jgi:glycosyltransferase involved in cell wall biosynthesis
MKLLYLTDRLSHRGGAPQHLLDIINAMAGRHAITVAASAKDANVSLPEQVRFVRMAGLRGASRDGGTIAGLGELMSDMDLVHLQNVMNPATIRAAAQHRSIVTVQDHRVFCPGPGRTLPDGGPCTTEMSSTVCSGCLPDEEYRQRMLVLTRQRLEALRDASAVIVLSRYMAGELDAAGIHDAHIIPPSVETGAPPVEAGHGFLIAGRLVQHKGTAMAHNAWQRSQTDHPLRVAGLGGESDKLHGAELLGWLDRAALRDTLRRSRALLFPTRWQEPFGIIGIEALSVGTPVIAMVSGGMSDWAQAGVLKIQPGDVNAMANAVSTLSQQPEEAIRLGTEGQKHVRSSFAVQPLLDELEQLYESTC